MPEDTRAALIAYTMAACHHVKGRRPRLKDFLIQWGGRVASKFRRTGDELLRDFKAFAAGHRGGQKDASKDE